MAHQVETLESHCGSVITIWDFGPHKFRVGWPGPVEPWAGRRAAGRATVWKAGLFMRQVQPQPIHSYGVYVHGARALHVKHCDCCMNLRAVHFTISLSRGCLFQPMDIWSVSIILTCFLSNRIRSRQLVFHQCGLCFENNCPFSSCCFLLCNSNLNVMTKVSDSVYLLLAGSVTKVWKLWVERRSNFSLGEIWPSVLGHSYSKEYERASMAAQTTIFMSWHYDNNGT